MLSSSQMSSRRPSVIDLERSKEIQYAMSHVIEVYFLDPIHTSLRGMYPLTRLVCWLLIDTYYCAVLRWVDVQITHLKLLPLKFRIFFGREDSHPALVRFQVEALHCSSPLQP